MTDQSEKRLLYLDFETFWDTRQKYSLGLKGKNRMSMVEYVRDARFKVFGMGVALDDEKIEWITGEKVSEYCAHIADTIGWSNIILVCHNTKFDGLILREHYECVPGQYICTKGMSKGVLAKTIKNHSLRTITTHFGLPPKGEMKTDGVRDLTPEQEKELADYCIRDVESHRGAFKRLVKEFPESQYAVLHRTIDMFINAKTRLNVSLLEKTHLDEVERRKVIFEEIGIDKKVFSSNVKFPKLLEERGYIVPMKTSPRTGKRIPALALGDIGFVGLVEEGENGNEELKALCEARVAAKSNLLETRSAKLSAIGRTGDWPFDIEFSGANQTHRFSGGSGAGGNPQNFTRGSALRRSVEPPPYHELVIGDFGKVECVISAYMAKDAGLIAALDGDPYCVFASNYYGRKITKADEAERRFGKEAILALGYGMGWRKFKDRVKLKTGKSITDVEAKRGVNMYREMYYGIPALWRFLESIIPYIASGEPVVWPFPGKIGYQYIELPSGLRMRYPNLRQENVKWGKQTSLQWIYDIWDKGHLEKRTLYGGKFLENMCQGLTGVLCVEAMMKFGNMLSGLVHDEIHLITKKGLGLVTKMALQRAMTVSPSWFPELKLKAEVGVGPNWMEAK